MSPGAYRDVILRPAEVYTRNVRRLAIEPALAAQLVADATGADALPLLAFTLSQLFKLHGAGHELTLAQYNEIGGMGGCVTRVLRQAQKSAGSVPAILGQPDLGSDDNLRQLIVPGLATWDPAASASKAASGEGGRAKPELWHRWQPRILKAIRRAFGKRYAGVASTG